MDATERRAEIARLRGTVAAGNPHALGTCLPTLARLLREDNQHAEAARAYLHAARVLRTLGYFLKAAAALRHAAALAARVPDGQRLVDAEWDALCDAVDAHDPRLSAVVMRSQCSTLPDDARDDHAGP